MSVENTIATERSHRHTQATLRDRIAELARGGERLGFLRGARLFASELASQLAPRGNLTGRPGTAKEQAS